MGHKRPVPKEIREAVFKRDNYTCRYCGNTDGPFHADHVYPESRGGETTVNNLVTACRSCNGKKSNKVGLWPIPLGILDEHSQDIERQKNIAKGDVLEVKKSAMQLFINLIFSVVYVSSVFMVPGVTGYWVSLKILGCLWLFYTLWGVSDWYLNMLKEA